MKGWICLHRKVAEHWLWNDKPFTKGQAFIDLLLRVNHKENKFMLGNTPEVVLRGSLISSMKKLELSWGWSNSKVRNFLKTLKKENMIDYKCDTKCTRITLLNYDTYQFDENIKNDAKTNQEHTNNNLNNVNNVNIVDSEYKTWSKYFDRSNFHEQLSHDNFPVINLPYFLTSEFEEMKSSFPTLNIEDELLKLPKIIINSNLKFDCKNKLLAFIRSRLKCNSAALSTDIKKYNFELFWKLYGKKVKKSQTLRIWNRLSPDIHQRILEHAPKYVESTPELQFRKNPDNYLINKCWDDEIT